MTARASVLEDREPLLRIAVFSVAKVDVVEEPRRLAGGLRGVSTFSS